MTDETDLLVSAIVLSTQLETGYRQITQQPGNCIQKCFVNKNPKRISPRLNMWTASEDAYVAKHLGFLPMDQIAQNLGRTVNGIKIHWVRKGFPSASNRPGFITANKLSKILNIDVHSVCGWIDSGFLPGRNLAFTKDITRVVALNDLKSWLVKPEHWPYLNPVLIKDDYLNRLVSLAYERWGDEWWTARQVADYCNCDIGIVNKYARNGKLPAIHCTNISGRHANQKWAFWYFKKSDILKWKPPRVNDMHLDWFTPRAYAFILRARSQHLTFATIGRMANRPPRQVERLFNKYRLINHPD